MIVERNYEVVESIGISTVNIDVRTDTGIYDDGNGIVYVNSNSTGQRAKRKVNLNITIDTVDNASTPVLITKNVVSFDDLEPNSIQTVYFKGTQEEWNNSTIVNKTAVRNVYYYSNKEPQSNPENYWHYVGDVPTIWESA